jgi:DNA-binding transcriptional regulator YiaG
MVNMTKHECSRDTRRALLATRNRPYHFTDSGLKNVFLVGIRYFVCDCGRTLVEIPAVRQLLTLIARDLARKPLALAPEEIRFLRKRLGEKQVHFAAHIGVRPETLSRFETGETCANERTDKLIRAYYAIASEDRILIEEMKEVFQGSLSPWQRSKSSTKIVATIKDNEWEAKFGAA